MLLLVFEAARLLLRIMLLALTLQMLQLWLRGRRTAAPAPLPPLAAPLPRVVVQLPICDELDVAEAVVKAAAALDWPRDHLEIQVLDDSTDETRTRLDSLAARLREEGHPVGVLRRGQRRFGKGGNLDFGLRHTDASLVAVFDADFTPPPDFLRRVVPALLADPRAAAAQGRWTYQNRGEGLLTAAQAVLLTGHMALDQADRARQGIALHFNGSGGVWRREAIEAAGGWSSPTTTEDLDLSIRVLRQGWKILLLPDVTTPSLLPTRMGAWRRQFARWTEGKSGVLATQGRALWEAPLPPRDKSALFGTLLSRLLCPLLLFTTLTLPLTTFDVVQPLLRYPDASNAALVAALTTAAALYYGRAEALQGGPWWRGALLAPVVMALFIGIALEATVAFTRGLWRRTPPPERTPKGPSYPLRRPPLAWVDAGLGLVYLVGAAALVGRGMAPHALFFVFWGLGLTWVGLGSLLGAEAPQQRLEDREVLRPVPAEAKTQDLH